MQLVPTVLLAICGIGGVLTTPLPTSQLATTDQARTSKHFIDPLTFDRRDNVGASRRLVGAASIGTRAVLETDDELGDPAAIGSAPGVDEGIDDPVIIGKRDELETDHELGDPAAIGRRDSLDSDDELGDPAVIGKRDVLDSDDELGDPAVIGKRSAPGIDEGRGDPGTFGSRGV